MRLLWILLPASLAAGAAALVSVGCSKSAECESSQCAAGNQCIDDGTGSRCHKVCNVQSDCPANWYCNDGQPGTGTVSWCVPNTQTYPAGTGEWGASCQASQGEGANPSCNWSLGFACYGTSPTDANAFCTQFACSADSDCPGGWWCSTQNVGPNVTSAAPTFGKTRTVCLPRTYCAPCAKNLDCYAPSGSPPVHCVPDVNGATFCSTQCMSNSDCPLDATCLAPWKVCTPAPDAGAPCETDDQCPPATGAYQHCLGGSCTPECASASDCSNGQTCSVVTKVCIPRAGVCVGDGGFCSPCRSDQDCEPGGSADLQAVGYCLSAEPYSTERFCSAPSTVSDCDASALDPPGCPAPQPEDNWKAVACTFLSPYTDTQCIGVVSFGTASGTPVATPGCWTVNR